MGYSYTILLLKFWVVESLPSLKIVINVFAY